MTFVTSPTQRRVQAEKKLRTRVMGTGFFLLALVAFFKTYSPNQPTPEDAALSSVTHDHGVDIAKTLPLARRLPPTLKKRHPTEWPPLEDVYDGAKVIKDPQYLLDFAIIGFEKSGSSTFMKWLGAHPQIQCFQEEIYDVFRQRFGTIVWRLYTELEGGWQYKRGYKCPVDVFSAEAVQLLDDYFPQTRLILTLRHPVLYYESLYNFRIQNLADPNAPFPLPLDTMGECHDNDQGVCLDHANFALYMYRLGKTLSKYPTETETKIIASKPAAAAKARVTRNLIFVVELSQLHDDDRIRKDQLKYDLRDYLGLDSDLPDNPAFVPGKKWTEDVQAIKNSRKINICDTQYDPLREELMKLSQQSATWILESFIKSDDVYTSSPEFFEQSMMKWMEDPCDERNNKMKSAPTQGSIAAKEG